MSALDSILPLMPDNLRKLLSGIAAPIANQLQEIRIREGRPLEIVYSFGHRFVTPTGQTTEDAEQGYVPNREDTARLLDLLSGHSLYAFEEELKRGYITVRGGHRIGIAGRTVLDQGSVRQIRDVASFNIRLAREVKGAGVKLLPPHRRPKMAYGAPSLIISAPQRGKTTLARDLSRLISHGDWSALGVTWKARKVAIVDERSELAACVRGVPSFDVGPRTDVLDGCPKAEGMMMMIRSMSPEVIVVDEIGRAEDAEAIEEAMHAGIRVIATAHGNGLSDIVKRPVLRSLIHGKRFERLVFWTALADPGPSAACTMRMVILFALHS